MMDLPVTYHLAKPIGGRIVDGDDAADWLIEQATFRYLAHDQVRPDDELIFSCHRNLRDSDGEQIPAEVLSLFDLAGGLRDAFRDAVAAAEATFGGTGLPTTLNG